MADDASTYPDDTVGTLMRPVVADMSPTTTVAQTVDRLRELTKDHFITYVFVTDNQRLVGVVAMRELLLADDTQTLEQIMIADPFALRVDAALHDAMAESVTKHFPVYPVVDAEGKLVGLVRGETLFEERALELSAQPGAMVGVERAERVFTGWPTALRMRHPWLQINLITGFGAALVVNAFDDVIGRIVLLAAFLPVLAGQSGNTGSQALAVTLRGLTLGDLHDADLGKTLRKELLLGSLNGLLVGIVAGAVMWIAAALTGQDAPARLALVVLLAMVGSCAISGVFGVAVPLILRRLGFDPATASSIFLTTATDVAGMGLMLALAVALV